MAEGRNKGVNQHGVKVDAGTNRLVKLVLDKG